jgi:hypothetical protein
MVVTKQKKMLKVFTIPVDVIDDLVLGEFMSCSIVMIQLIRYTTEQTITIQLHIQNLTFIGKDSLPEIIVFFSGLVLNPWDQ